MKYILIVLFIIPSLFYSQDKIDYKSYHKLSEQFEIRIYGLSKQKNIELSSTGNAGTVLTKAKADDRFIEFWIKINNQVFHSDHF